MTKASEMQKFLIILKRLHWKEHFDYIVPKHFLYLYSVKVAPPSSWSGLQCIRLDVAVFAEVKSKSRCEQYKLSRVCTRFTCLQALHVASLNMPRFLETNYWHLLLKCFTEVLEAEKIHLHRCWTLFCRTLSIFDIDCIMCKFKGYFSHMLLKH